jgi:hypothetical protein
MYLWLEYVVCHSVSGQAWCLLAVFAMLGLCAWWFADRQMGRDGCRGPRPDRHDGWEKKKMGKELLFLNICAAAAPGIPRDAVAVHNSAADSALRALPTATTQCVYIVCTLSHML